MEKVILLIEDNPDEVFLTESAFKKAHISERLAVARNGEEALDYLFHRLALSGCDWRCLPSLVLLDLKLQRVDGLEILRQVRANPDTALLPVVVLTSSIEDSDLIGAYQLGANSYIRKPVDFGEFVEVVQQLGTYWLGINRRPPRQIRVGS
jgi:two-component system response regulator